MSEPFATAVVIGASSGIGEAMVRKLAASGTRVAVVARRQAELERLAEGSGGKILPFVHDVHDYDAAPGLFDRMVAELGGCDLFVYNAGVMPRVEESEYNFAKDREMLEVNLLGAVCWLDLAGRLHGGAAEGYLVRDFERRG
jgi:NADP-dependent 3-hydroxy acid dehydrogenase YdfG